MTPRGISQAGKKIVMALAKLIPPAEKITEKYMRLGDCH
jgi:hypothetical protein